MLGRHAVVADDGARVFFSEDLVHPCEVGSQFVGCQQLAVFFGKPAFDVGRNGAVAFAARLFGQFADTRFVEYAVFAFACRIGFDQLTFRKLRTLWRVLSAVRSGLRRSPCGRR